VSLKNRRWARKRFSAQTVNGLPDRSNMLALSRALGVSLATVQHWVEIGLVAHKQGSRWEIKRADLKEFMHETRRLIGGYPERTDRSEKQNATKTPA
jgi:excisionase family DNA binding protein